MKNEESKIQRSIVSTFRLLYPSYRNRLFSIPNGGRRDAITGAILKAEGSLRGIPDLQLTVPTKRYAGAFFEVKTKTGRLTPEQVAFIKEHQGTYYCCIVRSVEEFLKEVKTYLS